MLCINYESVVINTVIRTYIFQTDNKIKKHIFQTDVQITVWHNIFIKCLAYIATAR